MKTLNQTMLILTILIVGITTSFASENAVTDKVNQYLNAVKAKEASTLDDFVNSEANFIVINNILGKKELLSENDYLKDVKTGKIGLWVASSEIKFVDLKDKLAVAYIESENKKLIRKEYLTLVLEDGNWEIVNSVSSLSKK